MLKEHSFLLRHLVALADVVVLTVLFFHLHGLVGYTVVLRPVTEYWFMFLGFLVFYVYFAWTRRLFSVLEFPMMTDLAQRTILIFASAGVIGAAFMYFFPTVRHSRRLYLGFVAVGCVAIVLEKEAMRLLLRRLRSWGRNTTPVLVLGRGRGLSALVKRIRAHPEWGLRVTALLDLSVPPDEFGRILLSGHVEEVLFCIPRSATVGGFDLQPYVRTCEETGRPARVFLNLPEATRFARWQYQPFMEQPSLVSHTTEADPDQLLFKRLFDIGCAVAGCVLLFLLYPVLALAIRADSRGPVVVRRVCLGRNGRPFRMYGFRCTEHVRPERLTRVGMALRRLRLDHLPQFLNVLRGDLSIVGVRPTRPVEVLRYEKWHFRRLSSKPGMTGLWQLEPPLSAALDDQVRLDLRYVDSWSLWLDARIVARTFARWLFGGRRPSPGETGFWSGIGSPTTEGGGA